MVLYGFVRGVFFACTYRFVVRFCMVFKSASHETGMLDLQRMRFGTYVSYTLPLRAVNFCWIVEWSYVAKLKT